MSPVSDRKDKRKLKVSRHVIGQLSSSLCPHWLIIQIISSLFNSQKEQSHHQTIQI